MNFPSIYPTYQSVVPHIPIIKKEIIDENIEPSGKHQETYDKSKVEDILTRKCSPNDSKPLDTVFPTEIKKEEEEERKIEIEELKAKANKIKREIEELVNMLNNVKV